MGVLKELKRVLLNGKKENSASSQKKGSVIARVVSFLIPKDNPRIVFKVPLGRPIGKVYYTVESELDPVTFKKKKDATTFSKLLLVSNLELKSDIVRREITDNGYEVTYGDRK